LEAACRAVAADHYSRRFNKSPHDPHVVMNVNSNWQIFMHDTKIALEAALPGAADRGAPTKSHHTENPEGWVLVPREPTQEMIGAGLKKNATNPHPWLPAVYRAMLSASPSSPASGVRVKALEWHDESHHDGEGGVDWWMQADTPFGPITLTHKYSHTLPWLLGPFRPGLASNFRTQDEAKAAAQADYEARILSALGEHP